jgi:hypothetical protein
VAGLQRQEDRDGEDAEADADLRVRRAARERECVDGRGQEHLHDGILAAAWSIRSHRRASAWSPIDEEEVGEQLETEGVEKFAASYQAMLDAIEAKRAQAAGSPRQ